MRYRSSDGCACFFQAEDGIRDLVRSRGLGDVYKRQALQLAESHCAVLSLVDVGIAEFLEKIAHDSPHGLSLIHI